MTNPSRSQRPTLRELPFEELVAGDPELSETRRHYAEQPPPRRRAAADWAYHSSMADSLFHDAVHRVGAGPEPTSQLEPGVVALAIDPLFAPALLTVGSLEYQLGRSAAAMKMFLALTALPAQEPDLVEIVEKAANLLLDAGDLNRALELYQQAAANHPGVAAYWSGAAHCLARRGNTTDALSAARHAVSLEPDNPVLLSDLGWLLTEAGQYAAARPVLERAVALAGPDNDLPRQNLAELERRVRLSAPVWSGCRALNRSERASTTQAAFPGAAPGIDPSDAAGPATPAGSSSAQPACWRRRRAAGRPFLAW